MEEDSTWVAALVMRWPIHKNNKNISIYYPYNRARLTVNAPPPPNGRHHKTQANIDYAYDCINTQ